LKRVLVGIEDSKYNENTYDNYGDDIYIYIDKPTIVNPISIKQKNKVKTDIFRLPNDKYI